MFCNKCGSPVGDDSIFCQNCGTKIETDESIETVENTDCEVQEENAVQESPQIAEEVVYCTECGSAMSAEDTVCTCCSASTMQEIQSKDSFGKKIFDFVKAKKALFIAAVAVILVITFSASLFPYAKNSVMKLIKSPDSYFTYVVENNTQTLTETLSAALDTLKEGYTNKIGAKAEISLKLEDNFSDAVEDVSGMDVSEYIDWLESAALTMDASIKNKMCEVDMGLKLNKKDIGTINVINDMENMESYVGVPVFNPIYLYSDLSDGYDASDAQETMDALADALPGKRVMEKMISGYISCIAKSVDDVEESKDTITADGISQDVTKLSVDITGKLILNVCESVIEKALSDKELEDIIVGMEDITNFSYDEFTDSLEEALDDISSLDPDDFDEEITLDLYVNSIGDIVGITIEAQDGEFVYILAEKGNKFGFEASFTADGQSVFFKGNGKKSDTKYTGDFELNVSGITVLECKTEKFDAQKFAEGIINGKITLSVPKSSAQLLASFADESLGVLGDFKLIIDSKSSKDDVNADIIIEYLDKKLATLSCTSKTTGASGISIPKDYYETDDYEEMEDWLSEFDIDKLCERLRKANVPDDFVDNIEDAMDNNF